MDQALLDALGISAMALGGAAILGLTVAGFVGAVRSPYMLASRFAWAALVLLVPAVGAAFWFTLSHHTPRLEMRVLQLTGNSDAARLDPRLRVR